MPTPRPSTAVLLLWVMLAPVSGRALEEPEPPGPPPPSPTAPQPPPVSKPPAPLGSVAVPPPPPGSTPEYPEATLVLKDGRVFSGLLIEQTPTRFVLSIANIHTPFNSADVERHTIRPPLYERYRSWRQSVRDDDVPGVIAVVDWLERSPRPEWALAELDALLARVGDNPALALRAEALRALIRARGPIGEPVGEPVRPEPVEPDADDPLAGASRAPVPLLTPEQINLLKVLEVDLNRAPRIVIPREVAEEFFNRYADSPLVPAGREARDALIRRGPAAVLDLMFRLRAREFYGRVEIVGLPESLRRFRDHVHTPLIINSCSTAGCHSSPETSRLVFATQRPTSEPTVVTNFYIATRFHILGPDGVSHVPLINLDEPDKSPLLQMALPRKDAIFPHPPVVRSLSGVDFYRPPLTSLSDRRARETIEWVRSLYRPRPTADLGYVPVRPFLPVSPETQAPIGVER